MDKVALQLLKSFCDDEHPGVVQCFSLTYPKVQPLDSVTDALNIGVSQ